MNLRPKNWDRFQHYKDRSPPWIKLHRDVLNDRAFMVLAPATRGVVVLLWLLASESADGSFNGDPSEVAFRLRVTEKEAKSAIEQALKCGFLTRCEQDASKVLATCTSETEGETEREVQSAAPAAAPPRKAAPPPDRPEDVPEQVWLDWLAHRRAKRATVTATVLDGLRREAAKAGMTLAEAMATAVAQGWQGFRAEWVKGGGSGPRASSAPEHPRNTPLGVASCSCSECEKWRAARRRPTGEPVAARSVLGDVLRAAAGGGP